jgi:hypothetical protein
MGCKRELSQRQRCHLARDDHTPRWQPRKTPRHVPSGRLLFPHKAQLETKGVGEHMGLMAQCYRHVR